MIEPLSSGSDMPNGTGDGADDAIAVDGAFLNENWDGFICCESGCETVLRGKRKAGKDGRIFEEGASVKVNVRSRVLTI